jgi:hypothetical protein
MQNRIKANASKNIVLIIITLLMAYYPLLVIYILKFDFETSLVRHLELCVVFATIFL